MADLPGWSSIGSSDLIFVKFSVAAAATLLLALKVGGPNRLRNLVSDRRFDIALICLAAIAFGSWWNLGRFHFSNYWHRHEFFHYFLATKYSSELGYTRLYDCAALAELEEAPSRDLTRRWTRDLRTNDIVAGAPATRDRSLCRPFFSDSRWDDFKQDVLWFRSTVSPSKWTQMHRDHGYNGTPVWTVIGHALANTGPATERRIVALALLDPILLLVMWATVWWAFGWRVMAVAIIWWGTNYPARYTYIGGGFLRADWLVLAIVSLVLSRRGRLFASGVAFGLSTLLRVFPAFAAVGLIASQIWRLRRADTRRTVGASLRFVAGCVVTAVVLVPASGIIVGGDAKGAVETWTAFVENSRKHLSGYSTNRVGLKTAIAYDPGSRFVDVGRDFYLDSPGDTWQAARHRVFADRRVLYWLIVLSYLVLLAVAVQNQPEWVALVSGIGLIPIVTNITCYYYGIFLAYAFLWPRQPWIGTGLCALSAYTCLAAAICSSEEDVYAAISVGFVVYAFAVTGRLAWANLRARRDAPAPQASGS